MIHMLSEMRFNHSRRLKVLVSEAEGEGVGKNDNNVEDQKDCSLLKSAPHQHVSG